MICNPQQARMLLLDWGLQNPRLSLEKTESLHFRLFRLSEAFLIWFF